MLVKVPDPFPPHALDPAREDVAFVFRDGARVRSLAELAARLPLADAETVAYHRAHLVPWVRDVVGDPPLARRLEAYAEPAPAPGTLKEILCALVAQRVETLRAARRGV